MDLVIAVILGLILLIKVGSDKLGSVEHDRRFNEWKERREAFDRKYVDKDLETYLGKYICDEANYSNVCNEVRTALDGIEYSYMWSGLLNSKQLCNVPKSRYKEEYEWMLCNRAIALDVMLAKRGKIANLRTAFGYNAYLTSDNKKLKKAFFEYAERIMALVNQNGDPANLVYKWDGMNSLYVWEGSQGGELHGYAYEKREAFDRRLVEG